MRAKRIFDVVVVLLSSVIWFPVFLVCSVLLFLLEGRPILYVSTRRVHRHSTLSLVKFRTMVREAERMANRHTIPISDQRFLNISPESPLYTTVGRFLEKLCLTEIPQFFHVLTGKLSLIGNRPLPLNVVEAIRRDFSYVDERFRIRGGMTGPVQLVGRDKISDGDRLQLEILYCRRCEESYSPLLDLAILLYTVTIGLGITAPFTKDEVVDLLNRSEKENTIRSPGWKRKPVSAEPARASGFFHRRPGHQSP